MEILTKDGVKKIYYNPTLYEHTVLKKEIDANNNEVTIKHKIKVLYDKEGELKGFVLSSINMFSQIDLNSLYKKLEAKTPATKQEFIRVNGEIKKLKTTVLTPSKKSRAKRGSTMLYLPSDWVDLLGIDENNQEVMAMMKGDSLMIKKNTIK